MQVERLEYHGESPQDRFAFQRYQDQIERGKSLLQLTAMAAAVTPWIRQNWVPRTFTKIMTPIGEFDELVCTISYHFSKDGRGAKYGSIFNMTRAALDFLQQHRNEAIRLPNGDMHFPHYGTFDRDGRIVTWFADECAKLTAL